MVKIVRRHGKLVRVTTQQQSGTPAKRRPCGCGDRDVAAIARASAEIVGEA